MKYMNMISNNETKIAIAGYEGDLKTIKALLKQVQHKQVCFYYLAKNNHKDIITYLLSYLNKNDMLVLIDKCTHIDNVNKHINDYYKQQLDNLSFVLETLIGDKSFSKLVSEKLMG